MNDLRKQIAKQGVATALSYSLVSNAFTSVFLSAAWYGFSLQVRTLETIQYKFVTTLCRLGFDV
jgi:hypothetical protein